jgi:hypothetical protein
MGGSSALNLKIQYRASVVIGRGRSSNQIPDKSCAWSTLADVAGLDGCLVCADAAGAKLRPMANANVAPSERFRISKLLPELEFPSLNSFEEDHTLREFDGVKMNSPTGY